MGFELRLNALCTSTLALATRDRWPLVEGTPHWLAIAVDPVGFVVERREVRRPACTATK